MAALGASSSSVTARAFGTSAMRSATEGQKESIASFMSKFEAVKPSTMDLPNTPSDFIKPRGEVPATTPSKLTLNFFMPHEIQFDGEEVEQVQQVDLDQLQYQEKAVMVFLWQLISFQEELLLMELQDLHQEDILVVEVVVLEMQIVLQQLQVELVVAVKVELHLFKIQEQVPQIQEVDLEELITLVVVKMLVLV